MARRRSLASLVALALLVGACSSADTPTGLDQGQGTGEDQGAGDGSAPEVGQVLLGLLPDVEPSPVPAPVATRTETWDLGTVTLADGVPAPLRGVIAWPEQLDVGVPLPLVMVLHGSHPICRDDPAAYGSWPCPPGTEIENERGLTWLAEAIAARGVVAIAPALNSQHTFGAGEPLPSVRSIELITRAIAALDAGSLPVAPGALDGTLVLVGHSMGAEDAVLLTRSLSTERAVTGLVLVQPSLNSVDAMALPATPTVVVLSECDGDVGLSGGTYVSERLRVVGAAPVALVMLDGGSHNATNSLLGRDFFPVESPTCEEQRVAWLDDWEAVAARERDRLGAILPGLVVAVMGRDGGGWAGRVFDEPRVDTPGVTLAVVPGDARVAAHPSLAVRPDEAVDAVDVDGLTAGGARVTRCPTGYSTPLVLPGSEPCHRPELPMIVGQPATLAVAWDRPSARVTLPVAGSAGDVLRLRAFADPADVRLGAGPIRLRIVAADGSSVDVELPVPDVQRLDLDPFEVAVGFLPWRTTRVALGADIASVTIELIAPDTGSLQIVSLGVD